MDNSTAAQSEGPAVAIAPVGVVSIRRADLALIARAARLFAAVFEGEIDPDAIVDEAADARLTVESDALDNPGEYDDIDTYVLLSPEFEQALERAEDLAGILPDAEVGADGA